MTSSEPVVQALLISRFSDGAVLLAKEFPLAIHRRQSRQEQQQQQQLGSPKWSSLQEASGEEANEEGDRRAVWRENLLRKKTAQFGMSILVGKGVVERGGGCSAEFSKRSHRSMEKRILMMGDRNEVGAEGEEEREEVVEGFKGVEGGDQGREVDGTGAGARADTTAEAAEESGSCRKREGWGHVQERMLLDSAHAAREVPPFGVFAWRGNHWIVVREVQGVLFFLFCFPCLTTTSSPLVIGGSFACSHRGMCSSTPA